MGELVRTALDRGVRLEALDMETRRSASDAFDDDVRDDLSHDQSTTQRDLDGGTGRGSVLRQIKDGRQLLSDGKVSE